jgi:hypothetical protein
MWRALMRHREGLDRSRNAAAVAMLAVGFLLLSDGGATASPVTYDLDAYITEINGDTDLAVIVMGVGSFTTDTDDGRIDSFSWDAIGSIGAFTTDDLGSSLATFDTDGDLTGLYVFANNGTEILSLYVGTGSGGLLDVELVIMGETVAAGSYVIRDGSGLVALGGLGPLVPEPSAPLLFGMGLMIAGTSVRRRQRRS